MNPQELNGIINVLKPEGMTSHDVIYFIRRTLAVKKAGHTGTLDPGVSGVLPVCIGKATRIIEFLEQDSKTYRAELTLGVETDTQDGSGQIINTGDATVITELELREAILALLGESQQIPPMVSALKVNGKKLYELAREGIEIERKPRKITIFDIAIIEVRDIGTKSPKVLFEIKCSKGTYIRTICHDIGRKLQCGGYMSHLIRIASGSFIIDDAVSLEAIQSLASEGRIKDIILPMDEAIPLEAIQIKDTALDAVKHGNRIYPPGLVTDIHQIKINQLVKLMHPEAGCLAIAKLLQDQDIQLDTNDANEDRSIPSNENLYDFGSQNADTFIDETATIKSDKVNRLYLQPVKVF